MAGDLLAPMVGVPGVFQRLELRLALAPAAAKPDRTPAPAEPAVAAATPQGNARPDACEGALRRAGSQAVVRFSAGSFALEGPARRAVAQLVVASQACPDWRWSVRAGADSAEASPANAEVVDKRVRTASEVLLSAGLPARQLLPATAPVPAGWPAPELRRLEFKAVLTKEAAR